MSELCKQCFIETWHPNAYDIEHIVMSEDNEFCEGCMNCGPYVERIDGSDMVRTPRLQDFVLAVQHRRRPGHKIACVECGAIFDDDDLAFGHETGLCQYCHKPIQAIWDRYVEENT